MDSVEAAILRTVLYADLFNFPLTAREIHHFLIHHEAVSLEAVTQVLDTSVPLRAMLDIIEGYVIYGGRTELVTLRTAREQASNQLWPQAVRYGIWLARLPFVRMVALTGSLAMRNAADHEDDLDYILVTAPRRVWLARAFSILLVRLARLQGVEICPNYVLAENALEQDRHNIFMAHEVAQMIPLYGHGLYERFRSANAWATDQLPNANGVFYAEPERCLHRAWQVSKKALEILLGGNLGDWLEQWEYHRKLRRFAPEMNTPHSSAKLDASQVKGHFNDHGYPVLEQYYQRLEEYGLEMTRVATPAD